MYSIWWVFRVWSGNKHVKEAERRRSDCAYFSGIRRTDNQYWWEQSCGYLRHNASGDNGLTTIFLTGRVMKECLMEMESKVITVLHLHHSIDIRELITYPTLVPTPYFSSTPRSKTVSPVWWSHRIEHQFRRPIMYLFFKREVPSGSCENIGICGCISTRYVQGIQDLQMESPSSSSVCA